jgi:hypothetical protein
LLLDAQATVRFAAPQPNDLAGRNGGSKPWFALFRRPLREPRTSTISEDRDDYNVVISLREMGCVDCPPNQLRRRERRTGPVFLSPAGKAWTVPNLSRTYSRLRDLAGLPRDLVLYLARHECGTKICREKGIEYARRLLGHANISTTQRDMHLDDRELADAQDLVE